MLWGLKYDPHVEAYKRLADLFRRALDGQHRDVVVMAQQRAVVAGFGEAERRGRSGPAPLASGDPTSTRRGRRSNRKT